MLGSRDHRLSPSGSARSTFDTWIELEILPGIESGALDGADMIVMVAALRAWECGGAWDVAHAR